MEQAGYPFWNITIKAATHLNVTTHNSQIQNKHRNVANELLSYLPFCSLQLEKNEGVSQRKVASVLHQTGIEAGRQRRKKKGESKNTNRIKLIRVSPGFLPISIPYLSKALNPDAWRHFPWYLNNVIFQAHNEMWASRNLISSHLL